MFCKLEHNTSIIGKAESKYKGESILGKILSIIDSVVCTFYIQARVCKLQHVIIISYALADELA